jgi:hypothetical protein
MLFTIKKEIVKVYSASVGFEDFGGKYWAHVQSREADSLCVPLLLLDLLLLSEDECNVSKFLPYPSRQLPKYVLSLMATNLVALKPPSTIRSPELHQLLVSQLDGEYGKSSFPCIPPTHGVIPNGVISKLQPCYYSVHNGVIFETDYSLITILRITESYLRPTTALSLQWA